MARFGEISPLWTFLEPTFWARFYVSGHMFILANGQILNKNPSGHGRSKKDWIMSIVQCFAALRPK